MYGADSPSCGEKILKYYILQMYFPLRIEKHNWIYIFFYYHFLFLFFFYLGLVIKVDMMFL